MYRIWRPYYTRFNEQNLHVNFILCFRESKLVGLNLCLCLVKKLFKKLTINKVKKHLSPSTVTDRWHSWGKWSECSAECGSANQTRVRFCVGKVGRGSCVNQSVETMPCDTGRTCPLCLYLFIHNKTNKIFLNCFVIIGYFFKTQLVNFTLKNAAKGGK